METLGKLSKLNILILGRQSYVGKRMVCSEGDFPQLQVLEFSFLYELEELISEGGMTQLQKLIIRFCYKLKKIPDRLLDMIVRDESMINEHRKILVIGFMTEAHNRTRVLKIAAMATGVESVALKGENRDRIEIIGEGIDADKLLWDLRKRFGFAELVSISKVRYTRG